MIWMTVVTWIFVMAMIASLAEMASMAPTAGGQYHWVSEFAPASFQKPLSYIVGKSTVPLSTPYDLTKQQDGAQR